MPDSAKLISACLLGIRCAWDGKDKYKNDRAAKLAKQGVLIPVDRTRLTACLGLILHDMCCKENPNRTEGRYLPLRSLSE